MILVADRTVAWFGLSKKLMMIVLEVTIVLIIVAFLMSKLL